jgi:hypothetical protein
VATSKPKITTRKAATTKRTPKRTRPVQVVARLSLEEKRDLDEVVARWEAAAQEQGFASSGFSDWLRAMIRREKRAAAR